MTKSELAIIKSFKPGLGMQAFSLAIRETEAGNLPE